jgi:hypothetical protein
VNLGQLRTLVRSQLDLDETDLPNEILDHYIALGYGEAINLENRWPFFEQTWTESVIANQASFVIPSTVMEIDSIVGPSGRLFRVSQQDAEDYYGTSTTAGTSTYWSRVGVTINLWPRTSEAGNLTLRGFRRPTEWWLAGAGAEVDADARLHRPLFHYAVAMAYKQQEDEVLSQQNLNDFRAALMSARDAIMRPWGRFPLVLGGGFPAVNPYGYRGITINV